MEIFIDGKRGAQMAKSAAEAASGGNTKWLVEDIVYLFNSQQQVEIARTVGREPSFESFFEFACDCVTGWERSTGRRPPFFRYLAACFKNAGVTFTYEGGKPPPAAPRGSRVGKK